MSLRKLAAASASGQSEQDFELNIASIIDCFTVLITYLLVAASFISIGVLDVSVFGQDDRPDTADPAPVTISVRMDRSQGLTIELGGASSQRFHFAAKEGHWDFDSVTEKLNALHERWPKVTTATVTADDSVEYRNVIKGIESVRKILPQVMLGEGHVE